MAVVYISSTFRDLQEHRAAVTRALRQMGHRVIGMEDYAASDARPVDDCLAGIESADIYIGIVAWRYGHIPGQQNPDRRSITEMEYLHARQKGKPRLIFLAEQAAPWPVSEIDAVTGEAAPDGGVLRLRRQLMEERTAAFFRSPEGLAGEVATAVSLHLNAADWLTDALMTASRQNSISGFMMGRSDPQHSNYLGSSLRPELEQKLRSAVESADRFDTIVIDIGSGRSWWSTRLFLLAALLSDYTSVQQLVFLSRGAYVGCASPRAAHLRLGRAFRRYEAAYRRARAQLMPEVAESITDVLVGFSMHLGAAFPDAGGDESKMTDYVTGESLRLLLGADLSTDVVEDPGDPLSAVNVHEILTQRDPFVALLDNGKFRCLVNRNALAGRVARAVLRHSLGERTR